MEFVNHQTAYLVSAADSAKALQSQVQDLAGELAQSGSASQFPRRNSNSNNVPVNDILKVNYSHFMEILFSYFKDEKK